MRFRLPLVTLTFSLVAFGTPVRRDAETVATDIDAITSQATALDNFIKALPDSGGTLTDAQNLQLGAASLLDAIHEATNEVTAASTFTDADANTIIQSAQKLVPVVQMTSNDLIAKKAAVTSLGMGTFVEQDLSNIRTEANNFAAVLALKTPVDQRSEEQELLDNVDDALTAAIQAYS